MNQVCSKFLPMTILSVRLLLLFHYDPRFNNFILVMIKINNNNNNNNNNNSF